MDQTVMPNGTKRRAVIIYLLVFVLAAFNIKAASPHSQSDSLPPLKQFRKMNKVQLAEFYNNDSAAVDIIKKSGKRERGLLFVAGGLSVLSIALFMIADAVTTSGAALTYFFIVLVIGILFFTTGVVALTLFINYFGGKKRRLYNQLKTYFNNK